MQPEKTKDVTINGRMFRIGLMSPLKGDWIITQMGMKTYGDPENYSRVQDAVLGVCSILKDANGERIPMAVYAKSPDGVPRILDPDLATDLDSIQQLIEVGLDFNFRPFFERKKREKEERDMLGISATLQ